MIKRATKKIISIFLVLIISLSVLPNFSVVTFAADGIQMRLEKLKEQFPDGMYWNHRVSAESDKIENILKNMDESYADSVTGYPCASHKYGAGYGDYDCNYFDEGYQCHGFAARLFYKIFGIRQSTLEEIDRRVYEIQPGDLVRLKNNTHSGIVLSVSGLRFTVAECNVVDLGGTPSCEISWGRSCSITDITYYVHAPNYEQVKNDTNWKSFESKMNVGNGFYSAIVNTKSNLALTVDSSNNVVVKSFTSAANQMWKFTRFSNGSYKITSCLNGLALDLEGASSAARVNVSVKAFNDSSGQKWAFYGNGSKLYLSADCSRSVLCLENGAYSEGTNAVVTEKINHAAQMFKLVKMNPPSASVISATGGINTASFSWTKASDTSSFNLEIYREGSLYKSYKKLTVTSGKLTLPAGNYSARIYSNNSFTSVTGNTAYFTVSDKNVLGKTAKVVSEQSTDALRLTWTSVPGATGYRIYYQSGDSWKAAATTAKTSHTFSGLPAGTKYTFAIRAYLISGGKVTWAPTYTTFTAATKTNSPAKLTATQSTNAIKLSWSAVKNADGYRIYYKTSSSWTEHSTTTALTKTFSNLPSAKAYTFAVRPYIKTTVGTVDGNYRSIQTATQPAAPKLSLEDVRNVSANIIWKTVEGADGYQVFYKLDNTSYTLINDFDSDKRGVAISAMDYNTYYTFAVRAYVIAGGKRIYGPHSTVRFRAVYL